MIITQIEKGKIAKFINSDLLAAVEAIDLNGEPATRFHFPGFYSDRSKITPEEYLKFDIERRESERRQELAKAAFIGIMANPESKLTAEEAAKKAVRYADALIKELNNNNQTEQQQ